MLYLWASRNFFPHLIIDYEITWIQGKLRKQFELNNTEQLNMSFSSFSFSLQFANNLIL